ncbi:TPA: restriction endonuclease subunit S [Vibrio parahaemolyticus]|nr:restriction endonuclease subunit S [Vibrio parahaemolyticus]
MGKYQGYPEYKDSETEWLGEVPAHWQILPTKRFFRLVAEPAPCNNNFELLSVYTDIGVKPRKELEQKGNKASTTDGYWLVNQGDIVVNKLLAWMGAVGHSNYDGVTSPAYDILRKTKDFNSRFYHYLFRSDIAKQEFKRWSRGIMEMRLRLYFDELGRIPMPFPPKEEIESITNFLDHETAKIDTLIEKQQQLIKLLKEKRQAVISHAVTKGLNPQAPMKDSGVEWLGEVPEHWGTPKLFHVSTRIGDGLHSTPRYEGGTGYFFVNGNNLTNGVITIGATAKEVPLKEYQNHYIPLSKMSVLLSINGTIGNVALYRDEKIILGKSAAYINCKAEINPEYLRWFLTSDQAKLYYDLEVTGTTIYNLSLNSIRKMKVLVPSVQEQTDIAKFCEMSHSKYEKLILSAITQMDLLKERRTALISAAVTGKIDVRNWQAPTSQNQAIEATA